MGTASRAGMVLGGVPAGCCDWNLRVPRELLGASSAPKTLVYESRRRCAPTAGGFSFTGARSRKSDICRMDDVEPSQDLIIGNTETGARQLDVAA